MAGMLETPSRVWRRIQDTEGQDMPSLPSLPAFEDSGDRQTESTDEDEDVLPNSIQLQSTPAALSAFHKTASTIRPPNSAGSTARFARSIISRSSRSSLNSSRSNTVRQQSLPPEESFDISAIPRLPNANDNTDFADIRSSDQETEGSNEGSIEGSNEGSVPDVYLPPGIVDDDELDITEALASVSRSGSPAPDVQPTPKKLYDYSVSLKSEPKVRWS